MTGMIGVLVCVLSAADASAAGACVLPAEGASLRGVYFNPRVHPDPGFPWLVHYAEHRSRIRTSLQEMADHTGLNFVAVFLLMPHSLATPKTAPAPGQPLAEWANMTYLDNVALFVDDCQEVGVSVALDLANNLWVPHAVDTANHRVGVPDDPPGTDPWWPVADETPWDESVTWYTQIIEHVESKARHPEGIAWWCMGGNYSLGGAEPVLWDNDGLPAITSCTEKFVKEVWPAFVAAGKRPKAAPYVFPIFSKNPYWRAKPPAERLSGFVNLKKWLVDDLHLPPDYWPMSSYPFCDPAPDGFPYFRKIVEIIGKENASRIVSTDFKGPGHEREMEDCIIATEGASGAEMLDWHFKKCREYGFAGWWIWQYQDTPNDTSGIRGMDAGWKPDLVRVIRGQAPGP
jgi:hypothetical protein